MKMCSLGDGDDANKVTQSNWDAETQVFDSQPSPSWSAGSQYDGDDAEKLHFIQNTLPFDDTLTFEDEFETQVVNPDGETQMLNIDGDTQMLNIGGETQVVSFDEETKEVDIFDFDEQNTQLFDDYDTDGAGDTEDEGTEETEVLDGDENLSDCSLRKRDHAISVDQVTRTNDTTGEGNEKLKTGTRSNEQHTSGSMLKGFSAIRVASMRASGLAARKIASERSESHPCSTLGDGQSLKAQDIGHEGKFIELSTSTSPEENYLLKNNEQTKELEIGNMCKAGRPIARKLFADDTVTETEVSSGFMNNAGGGEAPPRFHSETELAGLNYIDSQEPGEFSQANALDIVDKFLKVNVVEFNEDDIGKSNKGKLKNVSSAKGAQSLAKSVNLTNTAGERGIFDWDDNREDEGGGGFFSKKKEELFDNGYKRGKSFHLSQNIRHTDSRSGGVVKRSRDMEQLYIHDKIKGIVSSDSKLVLANRKGDNRSKNCTGTQNGATFRKNLMKELDVQSNINSREGMAVTSVEKDIAENMDTRFDTQMAAEAMETLCFGVSRTDHESYNSDKGCNSKGSDSHKGQGKERAQTRQSKKRSGPTVGFNTRLSKVTERSTGNSNVGSLPKHATKARKPYDRPPTKGPNKAKSAAKEYINGNRNDDLNKAPRIIVDKRTEDVSLKKRDIHEVEGCSRSAPGDQQSAKKQRLQEQVGMFTPVACRTRQSMKVNRSESVKDVSRDFRKEMNVLTGFYPKRRRTRQKLSVAEEVDGQSTRLVRSKNSAAKCSLDLSIKKNTLPSVSASPLLCSASRKSGEILFQSEQNGKSDDAIVDQCSGGGNGKTIEVNGIAGQAFNDYSGERPADVSFSQRAETIATSEASATARCKPSTSACTPPVDRATPVSEPSPICMGDEYHKQSCRKNLFRSSLLKELDSLVLTGPDSVSPAKDSRKRRDASKIQVLFSRHLDGDIIKQQKKILSRLGASVAPSMSDATHFIADEFVRTRNMLEAIALGKPVVTHLWLESCGQACCHIDEKNYILRDVKKEKEFGFSLPISLARASQNPILKGQRVLITPNTKPGKEILASLVKAVHGLAIERIGRSAHDKNQDELLVLSCEEDYDMCFPFLEKGAEVYSSELLLNGIVTQKLEYERYRLFADHVKRTRSTIWLRKDMNQFHPVAKCK